MVRIRLARHGRKSKPFYHLVAADSRSPRDGKFIEKLGKYDPQCDPSHIELNETRIQYWYGVGAEPTPQVMKILQIAKIELKRTQTTAPQTSPADV